MPYVVLPIRVQERLLWLQHELLKQQRARTRRWTRSFSRDFLAARPTPQQKGQ
jgi:hypothetical protein